MSWKIRSINQGIDRSSVASHFYNTRVPQRHIERQIGTLMSKLQTLPGATGSSTKRRKGRQPEKKVALTLSELEVWFAMEIAAKFHFTERRGLKGGTPAGTWAMHKISAIAPSINSGVRMYH